MVTEEIKQKLKDRYSGLHPLVFHRSCEYALSDVDLFDILDTIPDYPYVWNDEKHCWVTLEDIIGE